jgi:hypothetical protein
MKSLMRISLLGMRLVLASALGLCLQVALVVNRPDQLLLVQEQVRIHTIKLFSMIDINPGYQVAYNLIGGDNIIVHTLCVLVAYVAILILLLPFRRPQRHRYRYST